MKVTEALPFLLLPCSACASIVDGFPSLVGNVWKATTIRCTDGDINGLCPVPHAVQVSAVFKDDGTVEGTSGCNGYGGGSFDPSGSSIHFSSDYGTTQLWCEGAMKWEHGYIDAIKDAEEYLLDCNDLKFLDEDGNVLATFAPVNAVACTSSASISSEPPTSLVGNEWQATFIRCGDDMDLCPVKANIQVTAIFDNDGKVEGSSGCNGYQGSYQSVDSSIDFSKKFASTMMWCAEAMETEHDFFEAIGEAKEYVIEGDQLKFLDEDGNVLVSYVPLVSPSVLPTSAIPSAPSSIAFPMGTLLSVTGMMTGDGSITPPLEGTEITAKFTEGGEIQGGTGCNRYKGGYSLGNDKTVTVDQGIAATRRTCLKPEGVMDQENNYLTLLKATDSYRLDDGILELINSAGDVLLEYDASALGSPSVLPTSAIPSTPSSIVFPMGKSLSVTGMMTGDGTIAPPIEGTEIKAKFTEVGEIQGGTGCNRYKGVYSLGDDKTLTADQDIAVTRRACRKPEGVMDQEDNYLALLKAIASYRLDDGILQLINSAGDVLLEYGAAVLMGGSHSVESSSCDLTGRIWKASTIVDGTEEMGIVEGTEVTALFGADGLISGSTGCNRFQGTYTVSDDDSNNIRVSEKMILTLKACPPNGISAQQQLYTQALVNAAYYSIVACNELELRDADDNLLARYDAQEAPNTDVDVMIEVKQVPGNRLRGRQF